jgi:hypothetical protein
MWSSLSQSGVITSVRFSFAFSVSMSDMAIYRQRGFNFWNPPTDF